jgi:hypothetical protein
MYRVPTAREGTQGSNRDDCNERRESGQGYDASAAYLSASRRGGAATRSLRPPRLTRSWHGVLLVW